MLRQIIFTIIATLSLLPLSARELKVESFKLLPGVMSARIYPRVDFNGDTCALIKVSIPINGLYGGETITISPEEHYYSHKVKKGDTLYDLAKNITQQLRKFWLLIPKLGMA